MTAKFKVNGSRKEIGFTLIELMIGMIVGLIVLSAVIYAFVSTIRSSADLLNSSRMNRELSSITDLISGELRRTGFVDGAESDTNPFILGSYTDLHLASNCVLYAYDLNLNGSIQNDELKGFKLSSGAIYARTSVALSSSSSIDCDVGDWEPITPVNDLPLSSFEITDESRCLDTASGANCSAGSGRRVIIREVALSISAVSGNDDSISGQLDFNVRIPNDRVLE